MPIEEIDAALVGEATSVVDATATYAAAGSWAGDASTTLSATAAYAAATSMLGVANATLSVTALYAAAALMPGVSTVLADLDIEDEESIALLGVSTFGATANLLAALTSPFVGNANMIFDPAGITITNFSRGSQIPATARPLTVPTIRVVPPAPPAATYSVSPPRPRRREGL